MNELTKEVASLFESIKHSDENGVEFWSARELAPYLGYKRWENFLEVLEKAKNACKSSVGTILNDFRDVTKIVKAGFTEKPLDDVELTRYACYLVAQNGDPRKPEIAQAQTYFAIQTRYAEIQQMEEYQALTSEESKRLFLREELRRYHAGRPTHSGKYQAGGSKTEESLGRVTQKAVNSMNCLSLFLCAYENKIMDYSGCDGRHSLPGAAAGE